MAMKSPKFEVSLDQRLAQRKDPHGCKNQLGDRGRRKCYLIQFSNGKQADLRWLTHTEMVQLKLQGHSLDTIELVTDTD